MPLTRTESLEAALHTVEECLDLPRDRVMQKFDGVVRAVAGLRDDLIERLRQAPPGPETENLREVLSQTNVALSLALRCAYPQGGVKKKYVEETREQFRTLADSLNECP